MPTIRINDTAAGQTPKPLGLGLVWSPAARVAVDDIIARYPAGRQQSAVIPLLFLAQREFGGWVSVDAMQLVAETLGMPYVRVYEVATFYTMFNLKPVGKHHVQVCTNCACLIRGSDAVLQAVREFTGIVRSGGTSADGRFTLTEVECLGACVDAPMMQIGTHYYTNLDAKKTRKILEEIKKTGASAQVDTAPAAPDPVTGGAYVKEGVQP